MKMSWVCSCEVVCVLKIGKSYPPSENETAMNEDELGMFM